MIILDANILLYAYQADTPHHAAAAKWIERQFKGRDVIGLPWITIWAFLRVSTNPRAWPRPMPAHKAFQIVREWLAMPGVAIVHPGPRHAELLERLVGDYGAGGPMVTDAALAALAIENGAALASTDRDFSRFEGLRWVNPLS